MCIFAIVPPQVSDLRHATVRLNFLVSSLSMNEHKEWLELLFLCWARPSCNCLLTPYLLHIAEAAATEELSLKGSKHVEKQTLRSPAREWLSSWPWRGKLNRTERYWWASSLSWVQCLSTELFEENRGKWLHLALSLVCEDMWGICVHTYTQLSQKEFNHLNFKGFVVFHQKVCGNLAVKYG